MAQYVRVRSYLSGEVPVAAEAYWKALVDWPGLLKWMGGGDRPLPLAKVELKPGQVAGKLPCTRLVYLNLPAFPPDFPGPECLSETLWYADPAARVIYYTMDGEGPFGMRNYLASTEVDELGPERSRVTCAGRFDLLNAAFTEFARGAAESVYHFIIHDIAATIRRDAGAARG